MNIPNSRLDLDSLKGSEKYISTLRNILGSTIVRVDVAKYPEGYSSFTYSGPVVEPIWESRVDDSILVRFEFTLEELVEEISSQESTPF